MNPLFVPAAPATSSVPLCADESAELTRLRAENARLRALSQEAHDIAVLLDRDGRIKMVSPAAARLMGAEFALNASLCLWVHPDDQSDYYRDFAAARGVSAMGDDEIKSYFRVRNSAGQWTKLEATFTDRRAQSAVGGIVLNAREVSGNADLAEVNRRLEDELNAILDAASLFLFRWDREGTYVYARGNTNESLKLNPQTLVGSNIYRMFASKPEIIGNFERAIAGEVFRTTVHFGPHPFEARYGPDFDDKGHIIGAIGVAIDISRLYAAELTIEKARAQSEIEEAQTEVLERLSRAGEFRDDDTGQHTQRVGAMAAQLAAGCGFDSARIETMRRAAPLHDIGKIGVPDSILLKPGKLSDEEFAIIKTHCAIGDKLLADGKSDLVQMAQTIARSHHERFDGTGYPDNLVGDQIPIEGRIVAIVDVYDALTCERPYKVAWPVDEARAEIARGAGTQFDPVVVEAFLAMFESETALEPQE